MRITIGTGNTRSTVSVPNGKAYRDTDRHERNRFVRQFCSLAGIERK